MYRSFSYEKFLWIFEHDDIFGIDETVFYFNNDLKEEEHYIGCLRQYKKPYWAGYCDIPGGCEFLTAYDLFNAAIYDGRSIKDRWDNIVLVEIGGMPINDWMCYYQEYFGLCFAIN